MSVQEALRAQAGSCSALGSPFMAQLLEVLAAHWPAESALAQKLALLEGDIGPSGHSVPLRVAAGLHALLLTRRDAGLTAVYPPNSATDTALRDAVLAAITRHEAFLLEWTDRPPQTNEVRRAAVLMAGAQVAVSHFNLPLHLSELGASGGLNLMWDHYALDLGGTRFGAQMPAVSLTPDWSGPPPPAVRPRIAARAGVDLNPLDPQRGDHLLRLTAYLWPDQPARLTMTRAAAQIVNTPVDKGDAIDWLAVRLNAAPQGRLHLIQHSVAWQYFPADAQARGTALIEAAGARAKADRPLGWLSMESDGKSDGAAVVLRLWPGNLTLPLGRADFHGRWVRWTYEAKKDG